jgi:hypothetical protein
MALEVVDEVRRKGAFHRPWRAPLRYLVDEVRRKVRFTPRRAPLRYFAPGTTCRSAQASITR